MARSRRRASSPPASRGSSPGCGTPSTAGNRAEGRPPVFLAEGGDLERSSIVLSGAEGRHAATVRRLSRGERVDVTDGAGAVAECAVSAVRPGVVELEVLATRAEPAAEPRIVVVQAIPKGERGELAVEIMTEVGVDAVVAWQAERCVARWRADRADRALARWRSTAREAAKQARRAWIPEVTGPEATPAVAARVAAARLAILLDPAAPVGLGGIGVPDRGEILVIVGPEGGLTPAEADALTQAGAVAARLGPTVLRSSSAGPVAAALVLASTPRWA